MERNEERARNERTGTLSAGGQSVTEDKLPVECFAVLERGPGENQKDVQAFSC